VLVTQQDLKGKRLSKMKTADGQTWTATEQRSVSRSTATPAAIKQAKPLNKAADSLRSNDAQKSSTKPPKPIKMRPTQLLVSKNEGNTIGSWLRDIATIGLPFFMLYILATHPLIKDIGQPHNRKLSKSELQAKFLYEYNQQLEFLHAVKDYKFLTAMKGNQCCYEFPNSQYAPYMPNRTALFKNRYKKWSAPKRKGVVKGESKKRKQQQKKKQQVKGFMMNARKKMIPH